MQTKSDTIEAILALNPTASRPFLSEFRSDDLSHYLARLREIAAPPEASRTWVPGDVTSAHASSAYGLAHGG